MSTPARLTLSVLGGDYAVTRLDPHAALPHWVMQGAMQGELWSLSRTPDELSVLCAAALVPAGLQTQAGWSALKLHGPFEFTLTGILSSVLNPLRDAGIGIFALSTFDTDYVLVAREQLPEALAALRQAGHQVLP